MLEKLKRFNWLMFVAMLALVALGTAAIYSAGNARTEEVFHSMWKANLSTAVFGLAIYFVLAFFDYRRYLNLLAAPSYLFSLVLLVTVLFVGTSTYGGRRWLWFFQPSEVAKLCVIAALAWIYGYADERPWLRKFYGFLVALAVIGVPALLILLEPDLGTMLALLPATLVMLFVARVWRRGLLMAAIAAAIAAAAVLAAVYEAERPGVTEARKAAIMKFVAVNFDERLHLLRVCGRGGVRRIGRAARAFRGASCPVRVDGVCRSGRKGTAGFHRRLDPCVRACLHKHSDVDRARPDHGAAAAVHIGGADLPRDGHGRARRRAKRINT